jgi:solute carrier family 35 (UDP-sugar transporter), member A1/2/3
MLRLLAWTALWAVASGRALTQSRFVGNRSRSPRSVFLETAAVASSTLLADPVTADAPKFRFERRTLVQATSLTVLMAQQSALSIFMRASRISSHSKALYTASTAVVMVELIKFIASIFLYAQTESPSFSRVREDIRHGRNSRFAIPAWLYVVQNNMQYVALTHLPAQFYQVFSQLKIICAALFSQKLLGKKHSTAQWASILAMTAGIAIVQVSLTKKASSSAAVVTVSSMLGFGIPAVLLASLTSGLAGAYSEKLVKRSTQHLWDLNIQMSLYGTLLALVMSLRDLPVILQAGFFSGYSPVVWVTIFLHALGGLVTALVVKNTSAVIKGFAQSGSVILSCILSHFLLHDFVFSKLFATGSIIVCTSAVAFASSASSQTSEPAPTGAPK